MNDLPLEEWIDDPKGFKNECGIVLMYQSYKDDTHWLNAYIRNDGCIHFRKAYNSPFPKDDEDQDYIHICDIDEYVKILLALKEKAIEHFGNDWPDKLRWD